MGDGSLPQHIEDEIYQSRLQIVLLSPTLLQFLSRCPTLPIGRLLHPDRVLAIMLGVKDSLITAEHRSGDWRESIKLTSFKNSKYFFLPLIKTNYNRAFYFSAILILSMDSFGSQRSRSRICTNSTLFLNSNSSKIRCKTSTPS